jgi:hypothetical protein
VADQFLKILYQILIGENLIYFSAGTKRPHKVWPKIHRRLGSEVKPINLSAQNASTK